MPKWRTFLYEINKDLIRTKEIADGFSSMGMEIVVFSIQEFVHGHVFDVVFEHQCFRDQAASSFKDQFGNFNEISSKTL